MRGSVCTDYYETVRLWVIRFGSGWLWCFCSCVMTAVCFRCLRRCSVCSWALCRHCVSLRSCVKSNNWKDTCCKHSCTIFHYQNKLPNVVLSTIHWFPFLFLSLADFGFARYLQGNTMAATLCGSPMYMVSVWLQDFHVLYYPNVQESRAAWLWKKSNWNFDLNVILKSGMILGHFVRQHKLHITISKKANIMFILKNICS